MKNINIHFVHGWGFDGLFWTPLQKKLKNFFSCKFHTYNLGFFGTEYLPSTLNSKNLNIFIVHSYGFNWVVKNLIHSDLLINFFGSPIFSLYNKKKIIKKTINNFKVNKKKVIKNFYINCGLDLTYGDLNLLNKDKLLKCLNELREDDLIYETSKLKNNIFSFYSKTDNILQYRDFSQYFLNENHRYIEYLSFQPHAFPFLQPSKCSYLVKQVIENFLKKKSNERKY